MAFCTSGKSRRRAREGIETDGRISPTRETMGCGFPTVCGVVAWPVSVPQEHLDRRSARAVRPTSSTSPRTAKTTPDFSRFCVRARQAIAADQVYHRPRPRARKSEIAPARVSTLEPPRLWPRLGRAFRNRQLSDFRCRLSAEGRRLATWELIGRRELSRSLNHLLAKRAHAERIPVSIASGRSGENRLRRDRKRSAIHHGPARPRANSRVPVQDVAARDGEHMGADRRDCSAGGAVKNGQDEEFCSHRLHSAGARDRCAFRGASDVWRRVRWPIFCRHRRLPLAIRR